MPSLGLIKEGKVPNDNRVALIPSQCKWLLRNVRGLSIKVQHSDSRCFSDAEFENAGIEVTNNLGDCDILLGIKEVPVDLLIPDKIYMFFSHTKKKQLNNQK